MQRQNFVCYTIFNYNAVEYSRYNIISNLHVGKVLLKRLLHLRKFDKTELVEEEFQTLHLTGYKSGRGH